jgi:hypothetical protein
MLDTPLTRRRLLITAVAFTGSAEALRLGRAWAQNGSAQDEATQRAMAQMARRLYPHDGLTDSVYAQILDDALAATAGDTAFAGMLAEAENSLNAHQNADFIDLDEAGQLAALRSVEQAVFFSGIQTAVRVRLYNHPAFWELIGYEGPSWQSGGYLNRGAGQIDWLPEAE